ncbi:MAG: glycoside hydrolase family 2 TIM barrel-domain containing protein [Bacteroidota bacterium]|nr:glycoside hydrolase family 2 TIM barrel-domain containing protein [Bacteroidota bacterium]
MKRFLIPLTILLASCSTSSIDLSGDWKFQIDRENIGEAQSWFSKPLTGKIILPGSMASNGLGDNITLKTQWVGGMRNPEWYTDPNYAPYHDPDNVRIPYWLQPENKYTGAAWYQKEIEIPTSWKGKPLKLFLERVHWETTVWFDDIKIGTQNSLATAHEYILTNQANTGKHLITIRVDNRTKDLDVGWDSHSISDHTQSNWNGLVGELNITPMATASIQSFRILTDIDVGKILVEGVIYYSGQEGRKEERQEGRKAKVKGRAQGTGLRAQGTGLRAQGTGLRAQDTGLRAQGTGLRAQDTGLRAQGTGLRAQVVEIEIDISHGENLFSMEIDLGEGTLLWDEFDPNLYTLELTVESDGEMSKLTETFGLRKIEADSEGLKINHRPAFFRGTLECAIFPLTGYPSTNPEEWKRIMQVIKEHGLNHMRFHSWCPPEAAFIAADEIGVYLQVECSSWANSTTSIGDGLPIDQFIWDESQNIIRNYGNHPSFVMMAYGNEPAGRNQNAFLSEFVSYWKENDPRRLYTSAAGWPQLPVNDYHNIPQPRIQGWGEQLNSIINAKPPSTNYDWTSRLPTPDSLLPIPVVSHEIGQWCVYPNLKEVEKYTGVLKAKNFEIFKESLEANHMGHLADSFLFASGKLQALCYKAEIEAALRTPNFGGFQLLDLHDFPGQGTALVGVLDPFWEEKGYISPEEFSRFCNTTVPLARLSKRIFIEGETMEVPVQVAHYDKAKGKGQRAEWKLQNEDYRMGNIEIVAHGTFPEQTIPIGNSHYLGTIHHTFKKTGIPRRLTIEVSIEEFKNSWDIWVYPESRIPNPESQITESPSHRVTESLSPRVIESLKSGGTILLSLGKGKVSPEWGGDIGVGFSSIFWNTAWTGGQKPHTLGILCNPDHPALAEFPTDYYSNWQWWDAMSHSDAIILNKLPLELKPIVRIVDDWVTNRRLALLFEAKVGKGKILVSGIDLHTDLENRPEARQLLHSLMKYISSEKFYPMVEIEAEVLNEMVTQ